MIKKIAQVVSTYPPYKGGMGNVAWNYAKILTGHGHAVTTITPLYRKLPEDAKEGNCGKIERPRPLFKYGNAGILTQVFFGLKNYDAVILHYPFFGTAGLVWLARLFGLFKGKFIMQYHMDVTGLNPLIRPFSWPEKIILPLLISQADIVLTSSLDYISQSDIKNSYKKYPEKFIELPFGIDLDRFKPEAKDIKVGGQKNEKTILFVGGLDQAHYFKGLKVLFAALKLINDPAVRLKVIGEGELKSGYEKKIRQMGLGDRVEFLGALDYSGLPEAYRTAGLFVLPSITKGEAFGLVLIEAMASGVPVIASDLAGVRKVFQDGKEGCLAKSGDPADLAKKIELILNNAGLRVSMAAAARKTAEEKYDWKKIGVELNKIIR